MEKTELYIKNMVCNRCIKAVEETLASLDINILHIDLGTARIEGVLDENTRKEIARRLSEQGFELLEDKQQQIINKVKSAIIEFVHYKNSNTNKNISSYLSEKTGTDYSYISRLFSESMGITIEKYLILQKVERIKELLCYDELSLSEISLKLNYSSVAYLSTQFKNITGMTPSQYKDCKRKDRKPLDEIPQ